MWSGSYTHSGMRGCFLPFTSSNPYAHRPFYFFLTEWFCRAEIKRKFISICLSSDHWSQTSDNCRLKAERSIKNRERKERKRKKKSHGYTVIVRLWKRKLQCESTTDALKVGRQGMGDYGLTRLLVCPTLKAPDPQSPKTPELWSWNSIFEHYTVVVKGDLNCFKHIKFIRKYQEWHLNIILPSSSS